MDKIEGKTMTMNRKKRGFDKPETVDRRGVSTKFWLLPEQKQRDFRSYYCCGIDFQARRPRLALWPLPWFPFLIYRTPGMDLC